MHEPKAVKSGDAQVDFNGLYAWIAERSGEARADSVIQRLDAAIARLSKRPRLGRRRYDFKGEPLGFTVAPWLVLYEPLSNETGILVLRILDTRRDLAALLGKKS